MATLTLQDIDDATAALEKLVGARLGPKALLRVTRYFKWASAQSSAIRAAKEALGRELGEPDPAHHGRWHIPGGRPKQDFTRRLREALHEPAEVPRDLCRVASADLLDRVALSPLELASIWFMLEDWAPTAESAAPPDISQIAVANAGPALSTLAQCTALPPAASLMVARWIRSLGPALQKSQAIVIDAGFMFGEPNAEGTEFIVPPENRANHQAMLSAGLAGPAPLRPPFPPPIPAAAFEASGLTPRELVSLDWMIDWSEPASALTAPPALPMPPTDWMASTPSPPAERKREPREPCEQC